MRSLGKRELAARAAMTVGGTAALVGSFQSWADFRVQFAFVPVSGDDLGYGLLTGLLAIAAAGSGLIPRRTGAARFVPTVGFISASGIVGITAVGAIGIEMGVGLPGFTSRLPELHSYGLGLIVTAVGGGIALAGARTRLVLAMGRHHSVPQSAKGSPLEP